MKVLFRSKPLVVPHVFPASPGAEGLVNSVVNAAADEADVAVAVEELSAPTVAAEKLIDVGVFVARAAAFSGVAERHAAGVFVDAHGAGHVGIAAGRRPQAGGR